MAVDKRKMLCFDMLAQMCMHCYILGLVLNTLCEFLQRKEDLEESEVFNQLQWNCLDCMDSPVENRSIILIHIRNFVIVSTTEKRLWLWLNCL